MGYTGGMNKKIYSAVLVVAFIFGWVLMHKHIARKAAPATAQFQTCVWPHKCVQSVAVTGVQPCVWPNTCHS